MDDTLPNSHADETEVGAPADEVEVTPAMIDAGVTLLLAFHREYGPDAEETVTRIFRAMSRVAKSEDFQLPP